MSKLKIKYLCSSCGYESPRWLGKCPECNQWNTFSEEVVETKKKVKVLSQNVSTDVVKLSTSVVENEKRIKTNIGEFDRVLGGGLIPGSVILLGGDPGIGKSTLVMQTAGKIKETVLYVTGEESVKQVTLRAKRLKVDSENIYLLSETNVDKIIASVKKHEPSVVIIDSIQTMFCSELDNTPGTVTQIRESTAQLMHIAKTKNIAFIIIGHVTKDGAIAGPKVLEHIVDTVLQFEGERNHSYRIIRGQKNRFGSTNEIGIFEMQDSGLQEVLNPSKVFLSERNDNTTGSIVTASMEGTRPVLLEVQALVTSSNFGNPQRVATGFDYRRLSILLAVLEKRCALRLSSHNVFLNLAGGVKIDEPAIDLAVCCAIASSLLDKPAKSNYVVLGEVGLGGEIRSVGHIEKRIQEAEKLGFSKVIVPKNNFKKTGNPPGVSLAKVSNINEAINVLFE
ncbi:MAG: DNA repair protein RadA [Rhodothermaceae bacterium]